MSKSSARRSTSRSLFDTLEARQLLSAAASNVVTIQYQGQATPAIQDSYVAKASDDKAFLNAAAKLGLADVTSLGGGGFYSFTSAKTLASLQSWGRAHGHLSVVSPNLVSHGNAVPTDLDFQFQYALSNTGQVAPDPSIVSPENTGGLPFQAGTAGADIKAEKAWDITTGLSSVVVAVLDTGLDINHPDLANNFIDPFNVLDGSNDVTDNDGHGTAVASVIAAAGDVVAGTVGQGIVGIAFGAKVMPVKVAESSQAIDTASIVAGANFVVAQKRAGVNIVAANMSFSTTVSLANPIEIAAIDRMAAAGIVVVVAPPDITTNADAVLSASRYGIQTGRVVIVTSTDNQDNFATNAAYGAQTVTLAAPGTSMLMDTSAEATALVPNTNLAGLTGTDGLPHGFVSTSGTSFAAALAAGVVALEASAYPAATADQLVDALKRGVDQLPSLNGTDALGVRRTQTGGRLDAYNSLRVLQNRFSGTNASSQGNWAGKFGADPGIAAGTSASFIYGLIGNNLSFLTNSQVPDNSTVLGYAKKVKATDVRLLATPDGTSRSTSYLFSPGSLNFTFDFGAATHRLTLYAASIDAPKRAETIQVVDTSSGVILQTVSLSNFASGKYVSFDLQGTVSIVISGGAAGAVLNGMFVDAPPPTSAAAVGTDATTQGNWINTYGDLGYWLPGTATSIPSFVSFGTTAITVLGKPAGGIISPESIASSKTRSGGILTPASGSSFDIALKVTDNSTRQVSFYLANGKGKAAATRITQVNTDTSAVVAAVDVTLPKGGQYVTFTISGNTKFTFSSLVEGYVPTVSGVFFNSATFFPVDTTATTNTADFQLSDLKTQGTWLGTYGLLDTVNSAPGLLPTDGYFIVGGSSTFTPDLSGSVATTVVTTSTNKKNALQNPAAIFSSTRLVGELTTTSTFDVSVDTETQTPTKLSAYFVDYENKSRVEQVDIVDNKTGAVLSSQLMRDFKNGKYLTWTVTGSVSIRVTRVSGPSAVLSAVFKG